MTPPPPAKRYTLGTHRCRTPEATWAAVRARLPELGITRVADVTRLDRLGIPVYQAVRPASRNLSVSQGKGASKEAARVSAVMEAIELRHAEDLATLPQLEMSLLEMRYANAVPLDSLRWARGLVHSPAAPIPWLRARSLLGAGDGWLPRQMVELDHSPGRFAPRIFNMTSNGLASGNSLEEALIHGLCELVERHALGLRAGRGLADRAVVPESVGSGQCRDLLERVRAAGFRTAFYDLTWEVEIPTFVADLVGPDLPHVWRGSGTHLSPEVALSRALTEAAQSRLTYIAGARDDILPLSSTAAPSAAFDEFAPPPGARDFDAMVDRSSDSLERDLDVLLEALGTQGYEAFYVDLTRPGIGIPVVVTFVPGLHDAVH